MSEEKPNFKITDRRLFNPDGSPREVEREEPTPAPAPEASAATADADAAPSVASEPEPARTADEERSAAPRTSAGGAAATPAAQGPAADEDEDPQEFLMVVEFIASFAADALGMVNHPGVEARDVNPPLAKQCIDMLGTLQRKTRGNLNEEEEHFFTLVLSQLRMQYVSLTGGARAGSPRGGGGFTGGDITGGM